MTKLYVVPGDTWTIKSTHNIRGRVERYEWPERNDEDDDECNWTVSGSPDQPGWETDSNAYGYGIPKKAAEEIARKVNNYDKLKKMYEWVVEFAQALKEENERLKGLIEVLEEKIFDDESRFEDRDFLD